MPDPLLYLQGICASLVASVIGARVIGWALSRTSSSNQRIGSILAIGLGAACGFLVLRFRSVWPPVNGLDRFLGILLPAALVIEIVASLPRFPHGAAHFMRIVLIAMSGRILLHGSSYLNPAQSEWTEWQLAMALLVSAFFLASVWMLMWSLPERTTDISIPLSIAMATLTAGLLVMLAGYLKGGTAAFPLATALFGSAIASIRIRPSADLSGTIGIGVLGLFGILFVGRFFGAITTSTAVVVFLVPLLCWVAELPGLRQRQPWKALALRLVLVAIPLFVVLAIAKRDFDRDMRPLLTQRFRLNKFDEGRRGLSVGKPLALIH